MQRLDKVTEETLAYCDRRRRKDNLIFLMKCDATTLFRLRDAARIIEATGFRPEYFARSSTITLIIDSRTPPESPSIERILRTREGL